MDEVRRSGVNEQRKSRWCVDEVDQGRVLKVKIKRVREQRSSTV